jgi:serine/threonine-protein kinase
LPDGDILLLLPREGAVSARWAVNNQLENTNQERLAQARGKQLLLAKIRDPMIGRVLGGKYQVRALLDRGGMGYVYLADHVELRRERVIKVVRPQLLDGAEDRRSELLARFEREAQAAAKLGDQHEGIVRVLDSGTEQDCVYIVMERLHGHSLAIALEQSARRGKTGLAIATVVDWGRQILDALATAHSASVVHRDIKPANVFLAEGANGTRIKLLDFGLAKLLDSPAAITGSGVVMGTPAYASPEQLKSPDAADERVDLYSVGATLFHLLTGRPPIEACSYAAAVANVINGETRRDPRQLREEVPSWLAAVVVRAMAPDPADRFASASEMRAALAGAPVAKHVRHTKSGPTPWSSPRLRLALGCSGVFVALVLATWSFGRARSGPADRTSASVSPTLVVTEHAGSSTAQLPVPPAATPASPKGAIPPTSQVRPSRRKRMNNASASPVVESRPRVQPLPVGQRARVEIDENDNPYRPQPMTDTDTK